MDNAQESILLVLKKHWIALMLAVVGLIFFGYGLIWLLGSPSTSNGKVETVPEPTIEVTKAIDVEGEVVSPGVYKLKEDALVADAINASGGLSDEADKDWIAKNLNLASKVNDGQKIYIPKVGEESSLKEEASVSSSSSSSSSSSGLININTASQSELESLPGVGPVTAGKIIDNRPYLAIEELVEKKAVGNALFDKIKDSIAVN